MDEKTRKELGIERRVVVTESTALIRDTVTGLLESIKAAFSGPSKPLRILYAKGQPLVIERSVAESVLEEEDSAFITAYQMVRQHAEVQIVEADDSPAEQVCKAAMALADRDFDATMFVVNRRELVDEWFPVGKIDLVFRIPIVEDPECPDHFLVMCGSQSGRMMSQIEYAAFCRMEKS